ncbi:hypothetical protein EC845_1178 [Comamonas sp. BIGb0124]|uniref:HD domain-containing protein n=1 Tax=Comamonas sp. BIGb0124 TaxID=2485130 RepID=UPI000F47F0F9|nr:hypothetical protein [Comamonas sp. BIGb0124]ROR25138.1 hypothetical protein EC845_1178 [Comamonas sp. BIGb0124]
MTWILTSQGHEFDLALDTTNLYVLDDIASALAQINRFTGHALRPYSVAEHSLLCAHIAQQQGLPAIVQAAALMHDGHEAYVGDASSPAKAVLGDVWREFENRHMKAVRERYGLVETFAKYRATLHHIDLIALATERRDLIEYEPGRSSIWPSLDTKGQEVTPWSTDLTALHRVRRNWATWREMFINTYRDLEHAARAETAERQARV